MPHPIFNLEKNGRVFRYRYQYLLDIFPSGMIMDDFDDIERTDSVNIQEHVYVPDILKAQKNRSAYTPQYCYELPEWRKIESKLHSFCDETLIEHLAKNTVGEFQNFLQDEFFKVSPKDAEVMLNYIKPLISVAKEG